MGGRALNYICDGGKFPETVNLQWKGGSMTIIDSLMIVPTTMPYYSQKNNKQTDNSDRTETYLLLIWPHQWATERGRKKCSSIVLLLICNSVCGRKQFICVEMLTLSCLVGSETIELLCEMEGITDKLREHYYHEQFWRRKLFPVENM